MSNIAKLSVVLEQMKQEYPDGNFCIESFIVTGNTAVAAISTGDKTVNRKFTFDGNSLKG